MEKENAVNSMFTVKKVLRILSFICLVMVFCPSFLVGRLRCVNKSEEWLNILLPISRKG